MAKVSGVRPKKFLGQHFLNDASIAKKIAETIGDFPDVVEVGPGMGMLTDFLFAKNHNLIAVELDDESVHYLQDHFPELKIIRHDFLTVDFSLFPSQIAVIGNFPYNISSQILFKILDYRDQVKIISGMFQKEVAERVVSGPGSKDYGILSVLMQVWYEGEYLFTVEPDKFNPPPKVKSGVIRFIRNGRKAMQCSEALFRNTVKQAFNQRRKTMRNSLRSVLPEGGFPYADKRPEQLHWQQFEEITLYIESSRLGK